MKYISMIKMKRSIAVGAVTALVCAGVLCVPTAAAQTATDTDTVNSVSTTPGSDYAAYISAHSGTAEYGAENSAAAFSSQNGAGAGIKTRTGSEGKTVTALDWSSCSGSVTYTAETARAGLYHVSVTYLLDTAARNDWSFTFKIDNKILFSEMELLTLPRFWENEGEHRTDDFGNQITAKQVPAELTVTKALFDNTGSQKSPYLFYLTAGKHTFTFENSTQAVTITDVSVTAPENPLSYEEIKEVYKINNYKNYSGATLTVQGEDAVYKSSLSLLPIADRSSAKLTPASASKDVLNSIGGTNWQEAGGEIIWHVEVPESGLYKLGFSYLQNQVINGYSYRQLRIDGKIPFAEAANLKFGYDTSWNYTQFVDEQTGEPYLLYLEKGTRELSLTVSLCEISEIYNELKSIASLLGDLYLDITMVTGETPDMNRDYDLFTKIPDWDGRLSTLSERLTALADSMRAISGKRGSTIVAALENMKRVLGNMQNNPYTAQQYKSDYYSCYTTLNSWLYEMKQMPLAIDLIDLIAPENEYTPKKVNVFESFFFSLKRFLASFSDDYIKISNKKEDVTLKIWVNWGRDQAMVLNNLIQENFTEYSEKELGYKVGVNVELVNASLVKGILSNNAPDLALHQVRTEPVNLAMRGALYDLTKFDDYKEIITRFGESATLPYEYNGGTYALPDQQTFYVMFYRSDILSKLNIAIPDTWEDFLASTAVLQRNNMSSYIPYTKIVSETTVNTGVGSLNLYATILQQFGGSFYNEELNQSTFNTSVSVSAFRFWTDMYTKYKLPTEADFYNRFRLGTMPLGIAPYTTYTTLVEAAPEIDGRWGVALVPGVKNVETGKIDRTVAGAGTGCSILRVSKNKEAAWTFLKWWTRADTQLKYNNDVESILGVTARVPLATVEAFEQLPWKTRDLAVLKQQQQNVREIEEVPGSYYVSRAVDQAFWNVVTNGEPPKDVLIEWGEVADEEIERKINEYKGRVWDND